jgi:3-dehydroquinate dehydratase I
MPEPRICVALIENDLRALTGSESLVDFYEVRLDLVGPAWPELVRGLKKPWIACNRRPEEGGKGERDETRRLAELLRAVEAGAAIADIELQSQYLEKYVSLIKSRARCLISFHDTLKTPAAERLAEIVEQERAAGADICKVVTRACSFEDNIALLKLVRRFAGSSIVAFAMGEAGRVSRILSPLAGGYFTYASLSGGKESAAGQIPVEEMAEIYSCLQDGAHE